MYLKRTTPLFGPSVLALLMLICAALFMAACTAPLTKPDGTKPNTLEQTINATAQSYSLLDTAILGSSDAMRSNLLKGQDARNAVDGLAKAKAGLDVALVALRSAAAAASAAASATPGATK